MVTVLVLTYNHEQYIRQALDSVLNQQTNFPFEVIVHDDASTDLTQTILEEYSALNLPNLKIEIANENQISRGFNPSARLILGVQTKYFAWCEGDDYWSDSSKLQTQIEFMEKNQWCAVSHHLVEVIDEKGRPVTNGIVAMLESQSWRRRERIPGKKIVGGNFLWTSSILIRRASIRNSALMAMYDVQPGDFITLAFSLEQGDIGFISRVMSAYRVHSNSFWSSASEKDNQKRIQQAMWFLGTYSIGRMQSDFRRAVVENYVRTNRISLHRDLENLALQMSRKDAELDALSVKVSIAEARVSEIERSRSWKITSALRKISSLLKPRNRDS